MNRRTIHHFEDEAQLTRWIPSVVFDRFWSLHPEWVEDEGTYEEHDDERLTTFVLSVKGQRWQIRYRLYRDEKEFKKRFPNEKRKGDMALVDLMNAGAEHGLGVYDLAVRALGEDSVYFLTAFPHRVRIHGRVPESHILEKPPDVANFADLIVRTLAIR